MFTTIFSAIGETYLSDDDVLWWAKGGKLKGKSPERIAFLRELMESLPSAIEPWYEPESVTFGDEFLGYKAGPDHPIISLYVDIVSCALFFQVFPYNFIQKSTSFNNVDTYFSHNPFNHLASLEVIGSVDVSGYIGILLQ